MTITIERSIKSIEPAHPELAPSMYAVAHSLFQDERWQAAADVFRALLMILPGDERGWLGLGHCHERTGQDEVAIDLYSFCLVAVPATVRARVALARLLLEQERTEDADHLLAVAEVHAEASGDDELVALVHEQRRFQ